MRGKQDVAQDLNDWPLAPLPRAVPLMLSAILSVLAGVGSPAWADGCFMELEDGTRVNLDRRLCRQNLGRTTIAPAGAVGILAFEELEVLPQSSLTTASLRGLIRNRSNGVVDLVSFRVDLVEDGKVLASTVIPAPAGAIAPGQTVRFERVFRHNLPADRDWSAVRPVLVSVEQGTIRPEPPPTETPPDTLPPAWVNGPGWATEADPETGAVLDPFFAPEVADPSP